MEKVSRLPRKEGKMNKCPIGLDAIHCPNCSWLCDYPLDMTIEEAGEIVKNAAGRRPDLPSGKAFVDDVRHGKQASTPKYGPPERLLTVDEEHEKRLAWVKLNPATRISWRDYWLEAQDAKTALIKDDECQQKIKKLFKEIERRFGYFYDGLEKIIIDGIEIGRKQVVEFVEEHLPKTLANYVGFWRSWQRFKKEQGIE